MEAPAALNREPGTTRDALSVLNSVFGLSAFRGAQEEIVRHVTGGGNCLVLMPTGGGKSLCYQLPALLRPGCGIVVSPLIALMRDQVAGLLEAGVNAAVLNSTLSSSEAAEVERRLIAGDLDLLYVAPERLLTPRCLALLDRARDRAVRDRRGALRLAMGPRLSPGVYRPVRARRALSRRAAHRADRDRRRADARRRSSSGSRSTDAPLLRRELRPAEHPLRDRRQAECAGAAARPSSPSDMPGDAGIVYCLSRAKVEETAASLDRAGIPALPYHAGLDASVARAQPGALHQRGRHRDRRDHRVRHGHRQARRALRRASRSAEEHRGLLPGDRPRGPRRQAGRAPGWPTGWRTSCSSAA